MRKRRASPSGAGAETAPSQATMEESGPIGPGPGPGPAGELRVLIDAAPQTLTAESDVWGARIAPLLMDPVLPCAPGQEAAAQPEQQGPDRWLLRAREGITPRQLADVIDGARSQKRHADLADIERIETAGPRVRLLMRRPNLRLGRALCEVLVPGTGPYGLEEAAPLTLVRHRGSGLPRIVFDVEPDGARALGRLRRGDAQVLGRLPEAYWPEQALAPTMHRSFEAVQTAPEHLSYLLWNLRRAPFDEVDVRVALAETIDRSRLARELHRGLAEPAAPGLALDLADAAARLERAGYPETGAVRSRKGHLLRAVLLSSKVGHAAALLAAWQSALSKLGAELQLSPAEGAGFAARLHEGSFDVALVERWTPPGCDLGPLIGTRGVENFGAFASAQVDATLGSWRQGTVKEDEVWQAVMAQAPIAPLFKRREVALVTRSLAGVTLRGDWIDLRSARWIDVK